jgi:hypothetical protein
MFNRIIIALSILFCHDLFAQNWQLFPPHQLNHYEVNPDDHEIRSFLCDSVLDAGSQTIHFFRGHSGFSDNCYWQNRGFLNSGLFRIDSLIYDDTLAIYYFREGESVFDFRFYCGAKPGDEWDLSTHLSRKGYCTNAEMIDILGISDSVKTYALESAIYGNVEIMLSKSFGLIQFVPFTDFFQEVPTGKLTIPYYHLIGFQNNMENMGFELPGFFDYFHLLAGDILLWKKTFYKEIELTAQYFLDSIQSTFYNPEWVSYNSHRKIFDREGRIVQIKDTAITYSMNDYGAFFNVPSGWMVTQESGSGNEVILIDKINFDYSDPDTAVRLEITAPGCELLQSDNCYIICVDGFWSTSLKFSTVEGLTYIHKYSVEDELLLNIFRRFYCIKKPEMNTVPENIKGELSKALIHSDKKSLIKPD